jgi:hypothetical protein
MKTQKDLFTLRTRRLSNFVKETDTKKTVNF